MPGLQGVAMLAWRSLHHKSPDRQHWLAMMGAKDSDRACPVLSGSCQEVEPGRASESPWGWRAFGGTELLRLVAFDQSRDLDQTKGDQLCPWVCHGRCGCSRCSHGHLGQDCVSLCCLSFQDLCWRAQLTGESRNVCEAPPPVYRDAAPAHGRSLLGDLAFFVPCIHKALHCEYTIHMMAVHDHI